MGGKIVKCWKSWKVMESVKLKDLFKKEEGIR